MEEEFCCNCWILCFISAWNFSLISVGKESILGREGGTKWGKRNGKEPFPGFGMQATGAGPPKRNGNFPGKRPEAAATIAALADCWHL